MLIPAASARMAVEFFGSPVISGLSSGSPPPTSGMVLCQEALAQGKLASTARPAAEMQVMASTCTPPRTRSSTRSAAYGTVRVFAAEVARRRAKRRRGGSGSSGGSDEGSDDDHWPYDPSYSFSWDGPGDNGGFNGGFGSSGGKGGGGRGGSGSSGPYSFNSAEWDFWGQQQYEGMWVWQLICAASLLQALHFLLRSKAQDAMQEGESVGVAPVS